MPEGYCTVEDVRRALRTADLPGDAVQDRQIVIDAIASQTEWLRSALESHFYVADGIEEDEDDLVPTAPAERGLEEHDIPSTPHPQHSTLFSSRRGRYPHRNNGPYCRIRLEKRDAIDLTALEIRDASGSYTDWVADATKDEGDDYRLYVEPGGTPSPAYVDVRAASLPTLQHYDNAVRVSYDYGIDGLSRTVRRVAAFRAAADLSEEAAMQIPDNAQVMSVESKADELRAQAEELLEEYR